MITFVTPTHRRGSHQCTWVRGHTYVSRHFIRSTTKGILIQYICYTLTYHCLDVDSLRHIDIRLVERTSHSHKGCYKMDHSFHLNVFYSLCSNPKLSKKYIFSFFEYHSNSIYYFHSFGSWIFERTLTLLCL